MAAVMRQPEERWPGCNKQGKTTCVLSSEITGWIEFGFPTAAGDDGLGITVFG